MELQIVLDKKDKLEKDIRDLINKFQEETTLKVNDIDFFRPPQYTGGFSPPVIMVTVKVEI